MKEDVSVSMDFGVGSIVEGKVTGITKFGAFVSLPDGKSGLVHISEIAYTYVNDVKDYLQEGQDVKVKVINMDDNGRINLSIKKAQEPPADRVKSRTGHARPAGFAGQRRPAEPVSFEDKLKQFMQTSDSKLSELRISERRGSRRGGRK